MSPLYLLAVTTFIGLVSLAQAQPNDSVKTDAAKYDAILTDEQGLIKVAEKALETKEVTNEDAIAAISAALACLKQARTVADLNKEMIASYQVGRDVVDKGKAENIATTINVLIRTAIDGCGAVTKVTINTDKAVKALKSYYNETEDTTRRYMIEFNDAVKQMKNHALQFKSNITSLEGRLGTLTATYSSVSDSGKTDDMRKLIGNNESAVQILVSKINTAADTVTYAIIAALEQALTDVKPNSPKSGSVGFKSASATAILTTVAAVTSFFFNSGSLCLNKSPALV